MIKHNNPQEGLEDDVMKMFEGTMEEEMARTDAGIKVDSPWIKIPSGGSVKATYQGFNDDEATDKFGNKKFYFTLEGEDKERYLSSGSKSFLEGIKDKKIGQTLLIAKEGEGVTTKYIITLII